MNIDYSINTKKKLIKIYDSVQITKLMGFFNELSKLIENLDEYSVTFVEPTKRQPVDLPYDQGYRISFRPPSSASLSDSQWRVLRAGQLFDVG
jgi:hypothetical protein